MQLPPPHGSGTPTSAALTAATPTHASTSVLYSASSVEMLSVAVTAEYAST